MFIFFIILTFISTLVGGLLGIKYKKNQHTILGFTAGVILGVIAFDIFPEIISLTQKLNVNSVYPMIALVVAFILLHIAEKFILIHHAHEEDYGPHRHPKVGVMQALALAGHSLLDGVGIGLGFQVSPVVGILVAIAVISHDFCDGLNTVSLMLHHHNSTKRTVAFLILSAVAPVLGGLSTLFFKLPANYLLIYLGFFAGSLLYIGVSDILPEAHRENSSFKTVAATILGVTLIFIVSQIIG